jgi:hypothetical protein
MKIKVGVIYFFNSELGFRRRPSSFRALHYNEVKPS